ncbi:MAG: hypothetical protein M3494_06515 [Actinomycetota bacterium]|jgi:hypothetical protein|nr:hypothetical protein [Actinomycetota bacterium]
MNASDLIRRGGLAAVAGAALFLVADLWTLVEEFVIGGSEKFSEQAATTSWTFVSAMFLAGGILILLGLVALYARQAEAAGVLGVVGFLLAFVLMAMVVGAMWTFAFVAPTAAIEAPAFLDNESPAGPLNIGFAITFMGFPLGWLIFGIATFRAGVFPRLAGGLLAVGALVTFAPLPAVTLLLDIAVIWLGYSLFSERRERAGEGRLAQPEVHPQTQ